MSNDIFGVSFIKAWCNFRWLYLHVAVSRHHFISKDDYCRPPPCSKLGTGTVRVQTVAELTSVDRILFYFGSNWIIELCASATRQPRYRLLRSSAVPVEMYRRDSHHLL